MTFDEWWERRGKQPYATEYITAQSAYSDSRESAAKECIKLIGNQYPWLSDAIIKKFGLSKGEQHG